MPTKAKDPYEYQYSPGLSWLEEVAEEKSDSSSLASSLLKSSSTPVSLQLIEAVDWSFVTAKIKNKWLKRIITPESIPLLIEAGASLVKAGYNKLKNPNLISIVISKKDYSRAWEAMMGYLRHETQFFDDYINQLKLKDSNFKKVLEDPNSRHPKISKIRSVVFEFIDAHLPSNHYSAITFKGVSIQVAKLSETATKTHDGVTVYEYKNEFRLSVDKEDKGILTDFLNMVVNYHYETHLKYSTMVYINTSNGWRCNNELHSRPLESVFIPDAKKEALVKDLDRFLDRSQRLQKKGLSPYRTYLFHGIPGSGKTTMIKSLASYLNRDIYFLSLGDLTNRELSTLITDLPSNSILVIEEIDIAYSKRDMNEGTKTSFDSILNLLDGLTSKDNLITFITTNKYTSLDSALLRAGRISMELEFEWMRKKEILKMVEYWTDKELNLSHQEKVLENIVPGQYRASLVESFLFTFNTFEEFISNIDKFKEYVELNHSSDTVDN